MVTVYQRCLANYQTRQWDLGTHVLFNATLKAELPTTVPAPPCTAIPGYTCLGDCLLASRAAGSSPAPCLDLLLTTLGATSLDYFQYTPSADPARSSAIDACQVFTGPAALGGDIGAPFQACLDHYADTGACKLPLHVWSGRSSNRMPVGTDHSKQVTNALERRAAARSVYQEIRNDVKALLDSLNNTWTANGLQISIFSAEGDMLHQYLDCVMLGALDRVDLWPAPDPLPRPFWSRRTDGATGRDFELPCSGAQLNDRNGVPDTQVAPSPILWRTMRTHEQQEPERRPHPVVFQTLRPVVSVQHPHDVIPTAHLVARRRGSQLQRRDITLQERKFMQRMRLDVARPAPLPSLLVQIYALHPTHSTQPIH